ncbi:MAG TPA: type IV pilus secretin PilQ [Dongiaceae bacterium]|nr:type IV pilus secretin PilQ [Dongiaceae bacterium]
MRKQLGIIFVSLLLMGVVAAAAQTTSQLNRVNVIRDADTVRVEMTGSGAVAPKVAALDSPARVVVELPGTVMATGQSRIAVDAPGIKGVRIGTSGQAHPTTRVVVDLEKALAYELTPGPAGKLVLTLHQTSSPQTETLATPVSAPATTEPAAKSAPAPRDFVFVEPTYQAKSDSKAEVKDAVLSQTVDGAAQDSAARFSDQTAAELLPAGMNAAPQSQSSTAPAQSSTGMSPITPAVNLAAEQKAQMAQQGSAAAGPRYTGEPISVNLKDVDLKDFFRLIHEISGLNVVLDPNVHGTLTIVLDDVAWDQALDIVLKNNDLARELEGNVLRIATVETLKKEADARRAQIESEALAVEKVSVTRFLSYAKAKDAIATVKKFLSQRGDVVADDRTNAVIVNDIPKVIPIIDRLLTQLDRKTQEVEIEARVVAATRQFMRDIGTQMGFGWGNNPTSIGGNSTAGTTNTNVGGLTPLYIVTPANGSGSGNTIPLFSNLGVTQPSSGLTFINASNNVRLDFQLSMAESRGLLKVLSRPRVVTQNNIQALVKQGVRVPIVTQAQLGGPPTVTYVDAFLRLTVTPQITSENTIFLNVDVENTTPNFGQEVQGNPELITQQATTQVLVTDGGTVVIGGVIQTQNSINISQVPLLGSVPVLGNLFKHTQVNTQNQELIFFITPRIIQT